MLDSDSSPPPEAIKHTQDYPIGSPAATVSLASFLRRKITRDGPIPFPAFMAAALYDPDLGYYAHGTGRVGRDGDFFTNVSVGSVFGNLLARRFLRHWREAGHPVRWRITECGAHDGKLAADILATISSLDPDAWGALEYAICEPLPTLAAAQRKTLLPWLGTVRFSSNPEELADDPLPGIVTGNELLDALPFHLVEWRDGCWCELHVALDGHHNFIWQPRVIDDPELALALGALAGPFPEGYRTEIRPRFREFLKPYARSMVPGGGRMIWIDYGFDRADFYHPDRCRGTLRTFSNHRAGEDPLTSPGETDITAHVDFTAVAEAAEALGGKPSPLQSQGTWLTHVGRDWLLAQEGNPDPKALRQFQTLTHPAQLGASFQVLEVAF